MHRVVERYWNGGFGKYRWEMGYRQARTTYSIGRVDWEFAEIEA